MLYTPRQSHLPWFDRPNNIWWRVKIAKFLTEYFFQAVVTSSVLGRNILLHNLYNSQYSVVKYINNTAGACSYGLRDMKVSCHSDMMSLSLDTALQCNWAWRNTSASTRHRDEIPALELPSYKCHKSIYQLLSILTRQINAKYKCLFISRVARM
jgi:hypothetical protein